jgi:hypothetical protein
VADEVGISYPARGGATHKKLKLLVRGLTKLDKTVVDRATPLTRRWMRRMMHVKGVRTAADAAAAPLATQIFLARMVIGHDCMLRMCEHRDGMRVGDVVKPVQGVHDSYFLRVPEIKNKVRMEKHRKCYMPMGDSILLGGFWLDLLMNGVHAESEPHDMLFPQVGARGERTGLPASEHGFKKELRRLAAKAGMPQEDVRRLRGHSLRSGGATDYLSSGLLTEAWVQKQGGWLSQASRSTTGRRKRTKGRWRSSSSARQPATPGDTGGLGV